jgi:hypothetical protein
MTVLYMLVPDLERFSTEIKRVLPDGIENRKETRLKGVSEHCFNYNYK